MERKRPKLICKDASRTHQSMKNDVNINTIVARFERTGQLPNLINKQPSYGDFSGAQNYHDAMNLVIHAQEQFMALSAPVRKRFQNDPEQFLEFCNNPENREEMRKMGLLKDVGPDVSIKTPETPKESRKKMVEKKTETKAKVDE